MRRRPTGGGRPSKGDRHLFLLGALPPDQTDAVLRAAAERGLTHSEYLAVVIARAHGFDTAWPPQAARLLGAAPRTHRDHPRLSSRVPRAAADAAMDEAEARDMPYRHYVTAVVARAHGFDAVLPDRLPEQRPEEALISA